MEIKLAVCGDSWFSTDLAAPGQSFGEIICQANSWRLMDLARAGCSNFAISLQVNKAIELAADFVILGTTTSDRMEIPIVNQSNRALWQELKQGFDYHSWVDQQAHCYDREHGLSNVRYTDYATGSSRGEWIKDPTVISDTMNNLLFENVIGPSKEQITALKHYMTYLHDTMLRKQTEAWIISDACRRLYQARIPFVIFIEGLFQYDFHKDIDWVNEENIFRPADLCLYTLPKSDWLFHYCPETGSPIVADKLTPRIKNLLQ